MNSFLNIYHNKIIESLNIYLYNKHKRNQENKLSCAQFSFFFLFNSNRKADCDASKLLLSFYFEGVLIGANETCKMLKKDMVK
jgi:hypothetical protein